MIRRTRQSSTLHLQTVMSLKPRCATEYHYKRNRCLCVVACAVLQLSAERFNHHALDTFYRANGGSTVDTRDPSAHNIPQRCGTSPPILQGLCILCCQGVGREACMVEYLALCRLGRYVSHIRMNAHVLTMGSGWRASLAAS